VMVDGSIRHNIFICCDTDLPALKINTIYNEVDWVEAVCSLETLVKTYQTKRFHNPQDRIHPFLLMKMHLFNTCFLAKFYPMVIKFKDLFYLRKVSLIISSEAEIIYLLTELSLSSEAASCAAIQDLPRILWNRKVHHSVHRSPPLAPILSQIDSVHTISSYLSKIYFNIVHLPSSWSS
jgi:hypothetical protein